MNKELQSFINYNIKGELTMDDKTILDFCDGMIKSFLNLPDERRLQMYKLAGAAFMSEGKLAPEAVAMLGMQQKSK